MGDFPIMTDNGTFIINGTEKIKVIKIVRDITGLGLKEAKDLVESAPTAVKEAISKKNAEEIVAKFTEVGATSEIK